VKKPAGRFFYDDQIEQLKRYLPPEKFHPDETMRFIDYLDGLCLEAQTFVPLEDRKDVADELGAIHKDLTAASKRLQRVANHAILPTISFDQTPLDLENTMMTRQLRVDVTAIEAIAGRVKDCIDTINGLSPQRPGRPSADSDGFVRQVVELFEGVFGIPPTLYKDGPLWCVVRIALEAAGRPHADPTRAIKQALGAQSKTD